MATFARQATMNANPELSDPDQYRRESRKTATIFLSSLVNIYPLLVSAFGLAILFLPSYGDLLLVGGLIVWFTIQPSKYEFPLDAPNWQRHPSKRENHGLSKAFSEGRLRGARKKGNASLILGFEYLRMRLLGINVDKETRHTLVIGSTGSGKTVLIIALVFQVLLQEKSSALIVDGKADIKLFWDLFGLLKRTNKLHSFLVLNFLSGADCLSEDHVHDDDIISHKMNPFNIGTAPQINNLVMGLGRSADGGDNGFWQGRSSSVLGAGMVYLCYRRDKLGEDLDITVIRNSLPLRTMLINAADRTAPAKYTAPIRQYLKTLPGISEDMFNMTPEQLATLEIYQKADEQHIYALMTIQEIMSDLAETMSHIFVTKHSEVNMTDVLMGGRVCLVLLPAIEKSIDSVAALGRLLLSGLRPALALAAGCQLQGDRLVRLESRPASATYPIRLFLDEYGMYGVAGFFVLAALLRSYGIHLLFGAQTAGMFKRAGGQEEYEALMGNLNNKIILKNEDSEESLRFIQGRTGKIWQAKVDRIEATAFGSKHSPDDIRMSESDMFSARLLASPEPGEGVYVFGDKVMPFKGLYIEPPKVDDARLNSFAQIRDPYDEEIDEIKAREFLGSEGYVAKINDFVAHEMEKLALPEFSNMLNILDSTGLVPNDLHQQIVVTLGLLEVAEDLEVEKARAEVAGETEGCDLDKPVHETDMQSELVSVEQSEAELEAFATDAEMQVGELLDAEDDEYNGMFAVGSEVHVDTTVVFDDELEMDFADYEGASGDVSSTFYAPDIPEGQDDRSVYFQETEGVKGGNGAQLTQDDDSEQDDSGGSGATSVYGALANKFTSQFAAVNLNNSDLAEVMNEYQIEPKLALEMLSVIYQDTDNLDSAAAVELLKKTFSYPVGGLPEPCDEQSVTAIVDSLMSQLYGYL